MLFIAVAVVVGLVLLAVCYGQDFSSPSIAASLLIEGSAVFGVGGMLYTGRAIWQWPVGQTARYLVWERGVVIVALMTNVLGLVLLEDLLRSAGDSGIAHVSMIAFLFGAVIIVSAETAFLGTRDWNYPQVIFYVVVAFLAQAGFGVALIRTDLVAGWVGWAAIVWNLGWLIALPIVSPRDLYYPVLHHVAPLFIGIALLVKG